MVVLCTSKKTIPKQKLTPQELSLKLAMSWTEELIHELASRVCVGCVAEAVEFAIHYRVSVYTYYFQNY
jgi:hypothetical protein